MKMLLRLARPIAKLLALTLPALVAFAATTAAAPASTPVFRPLPAHHGAHYRPDAESLVYAFKSGSDGDLPYGGLVADSQGVLYGTTLHGGNPSNGLGTVYKLTPTGQGTYAESVIWTFSGSPSDGQYPYGGLIVDRNGVLYGTTYEGGKIGYGTVFKLTPSPSGSGYTETILYNFQGGVNDGGNPFAGLYMDANGALYGTTVNDGGPSGGAGTVFKLTPSGSGGYSYNLIYAFQGNGDGATPWAGVIGDARGNLYGTTANGGSVQNYGSVYKLTPVGSGSSYKESILYNFPYPGGNHPFASLILDSFGSLYGTTTEGGPYNAGNVFELVSVGSGTYTERTLYTFEGCGFSGPCDGAEPEAGLFMDPSTCSLYGTTQYGGINGVGTVFKLSAQIGLVANPRRGGCIGPVSLPFTYVESLLYTFQGSSDGKNPEAGLIEQGGLLYGTAFYGGGPGDGTVFSVNP